MLCQSINTAWNEHTPGFSIFLGRIVQIGTFGEQKNKIKYLCVPILKTSSYTRRWAYGNQSLQSAVTFDFLIYWLFYFGCSVNTDQISASFISINKIMNATFFTPGIVEDYCWTLCPSTYRNVNSNKLCPFRLIFSSLDFRELCCSCYSLLAKSVVYCFVLVCIVDIIKDKIRHWRK